jgi:hypothetical protein
MDSSRNFLPQKISLNVCHLLGLFRSLSNRFVHREDEDLWKQGHIAFRRTAREHAAILTAPKPDLYVALPIVLRFSNPRGFHRDDSIQNFTHDSLASPEEGKNGLISNPITPLDTVEEIDEKNLVCFPCSC